jgi:N-acetylglucosamine-6-phosphate deacetylase
MPQYIAAASLFTGKEWLQKAVIEINDGIITSIDYNGYDATKAFPVIVPAFIDLQIYGADQKLLSEFPDANCIQKIYAYCLAGGAAYFQPTIASQSIDVIYKAIDAVKAYKTSGGKGCIGLHIEGPWINAAKKGAHNENVIHSPSVEEVEEIINYGSGYISMITLAPEICDPNIIDIIQSYGIVVSAGHSNANYEKATQFFDNNIKVATHLFNAMSPFAHRAPGMVGALFNHDHAMSSIIVDGHHVNYNAVKTAKKIMGERLFCITDAVTATSTGFYKHALVGDKYESDGTLSGSALTQLKSVQNLVEHVGVDFTEAIKMCSVYPARVMQKKEMSGCIQIGAAAALVCLNDNNELMKIIAP